MIRLDSINKSIRISSNATASTVEPIFVTSYDDIKISTPVFTPGSFDGSLNGTLPVTAVSPPSSTFFRNIKYISVLNIDSVQHVITVQLLNNATVRNLIIVTLSPGESLVFNDGSGWAVYNSIGEMKVTANSGTNYKTGTIGFSTNNNGSTIGTGIKAYISVPFSGTITSWLILSDQIGNAQVDVWKSSFVNYPPTIANTITGTDKPNLISQQKNSNNSISLWTNKTINAGDIIAFNVDSATSVTKLTVQIQIIKD